MGGSFIARTNANEPIVVNTPEATMSAQDARKASLDKNESSVPITSL